ncbi:YtxH domain-containing protein [Pseudolysinimonas sp.]|uniref:YtxH domain-containing protein n=1 Tax=Pseudolysinimonas sp. TaxID=2680009 RepID=UPI003F8047D2
MKGKLLFIAGLGVGYVLGTRAGREQYEKLKTQAARLWNDPRVQKQVDAVEDYVKDKAPEVAEIVADNAKKVVRQISNRKPASTTTRTRSSSSGANRSTASKPRSAES